MAILISVWFSVALCWAQLLSSSVGQVLEVVLTSREVSIHVYLERALSGADETALKAKVPSLESKAFARETSAALMEKAVFLEAEAFGEKAVVVDTTENRELFRKLSKVSGWQALEVTQPVFMNSLERKLRAKRFVQEKTRSSTAVITDLEARKYFEENRARFGKLPFESFVENIKAFLSRNQADQRLKDWYEVLKGKYQIRSHLSES